MNIADYGFAIWETFYVTVLSTAFALVLGLPLGVLLVAGDKDGILPLPGWLMWHVWWRPACGSWTRAWWKLPRAWARPPSRSSPRS